MKAQKLSNIWQRKNSMKLQLAVEQVPSMVL